MAPQAKPASSTIPVAPSQAALCFLPVLKSQSGEYFPEIDLTRLSKAHVVSDIASAQHERVLRVIAFDPVSGRCWDASREIASDVLNEVIGERNEVPTWCVDFIEAHLGVRAVIEAQREAA